MVLINLLKPLPVVPAVVLPHIVYVLDHLVFDGLPEGIAEDHIREILILKISRSGKAQHIPESILLIQQKFLPFLHIPIL